jgi:arginine decarboxylase
MMQAGYSGHQVEQQLVSNYHIQPEYSDAVQATFLLAPWQEPEEWLRLADALAVIRPAAPGKSQSYPFVPLPLPEQALPPRQAALAAAATIPWQQAAGRVAAAIIAPYPPGIPLWAPGERITQLMLEYLQATLRQGGTVRGLNPGGTVTVVR